MVRPELEERCQEVETFLEGCKGSSHEEHEQLKNMFEDLLTSHTGEPTSMRNYFG